MKKNAYKPLLLNLSVWQNEEIKRLAKESNQSITSFIVQKVLGERNQCEIFVDDKENESFNEVIGYITAYKDLGLRTDAIAKKLNEKGLKTKQGKEFNSANIRKMLSKLRKSKKDI